MNRLARRPSPDFVDTGLNGHFAHLLFRRGEICQGGAFSASVGEDRDALKDAGLGFPCSLTLLTNRVRL